MGSGHSHLSPTSTQLGVLVTVGSALLIPSESPLSPPPSPGCAPPRLLLADVRANENFALAAMQTLFAREHNRRCDELVALHPDWSDEQLYQAARRYVIAVIQVCMCAACCA